MFKIPSHTVNVGNDMGHYQIRYTTLITLVMRDVVIGTGKRHEDQSILRMQYGNSSPR